MKGLKSFFNKRNMMGILISGLAGFLVLSLTGLGDKVLTLINKYR